MMKSVTDKQYKVVALNNNVWKMSTPDSDTYRVLTAKLNAEAIQWYTYENKNDRPIKVMARGLHSTCSKVEILEDLKSRGLQAIDANNIMKKERQENDKVYKKRLPLFMSTFSN